MSLGRKNGLMWRQQRQWYVIPTGRWYGSLEYSYCRLVRIYLCGAPMYSGVCTSVVQVWFCFLPSRRHFVAFFVFYYLVYLSYGGSVRVKLKLPLFHISDTFVFRFNPRSRCNSSSRCCYRAPYVACFVTLWPLATYMIRSSQENNLLKILAFNYVRSEVTIIDVWTYI